MNYRFQLHPAVELSIVVSIQAMELSQTALYVNSFLAQHHRLA